MAPAEMLLAPCKGSCTCNCLLRYLKASLVEQSPFCDGFHFIVSLLWME
jgi:hypothetical protein